MNGHLRMIRNGRKKLLQKLIFLMKRIIKNRNIRDGIIQRLRNSMIDELEKLSKERTLIKINIKSIIKKNLKKKLALKPNLNRTMVNSLQHLNRALISYCQFYF